MKIKIRKRAKRARHGNHGVCVWCSLRKLKPLARLVTQNSFSTGLQRWCTHRDSIEAHTVWCLMSSWPSSALSVAASFGFLRRRRGSVWFFDFWPSFLRSRSRLLGSGVRIKKEAGGEALHHPSRARQVRWPVPCSFVLVSSSSLTQHLFRHGDAKGNK